MPGVITGGKKINDLDSGLKEADILSLSVPLNKDTHNMINFEKNWSISSEFSGLEEGLVGYWNLEEGQGITAYDQTSNGNNGTINHML